MAKRQLPLFKHAEIYRNVLHRVVFDLLKQSKIGFTPHSLDARRKPSALEGWIFEILYCEKRSRPVCGSFLRFGEMQGWELKSYYAVEPSSNHDVRVK